MKIDLPVTIIFDCQQTDSASIAHAAGHIVGTLRYETEGDGTDATLFGTYPPNEKPVYISGCEFIPKGEPALAVLSYMETATDKRINGRAARSPYDYLHAGVTEEDRTAAQDEVDAEADPTP